MEKISATTNITNVWQDICLINPHRVTKLSKQTHFG
jgi:hypothetical protein